MGWLLILVIAVVWIVVDQVRVDNKVKKMNQHMAMTGGFLKTDYKRHDILWQDIRRDWDEEKRLFPPEYVNYFSRNREALLSYIGALVSQQEIAEGLAPICVGTYNKFTYDPFSGFNYNYKEKIRIFIETGVYYY